MIVQTPEGDIIRGATVVIGFDSQVGNQLIFIITSEGATIVTIAITPSAVTRYSQRFLGPDKFQEIIDYMQIMPSPFLRMLEEEWRKVCLEDENKPIRS